MDLAKVQKKAREAKIALAEEKRRWAIETIETQIWDAASAGADCLKLIKFHRYNPEGVNLDTVNLADYAEFFVSLGFSLETRANGDQLLGWPDKTDDLLKADK